MQTKNPTWTEILILVPPDLLDPLLRPVQPVLAAQSAATQYGSQYIFSENKIKYCVNVKPCAIQLSIS